jgi:hypothetical protein
LADCGNLKFPDRNFTDFAEKTLNFTDFGEKNLFWPCFTCYLSGKMFLNPNLSGGSLENFVLRKKKFAPSPECSNL